MKSNSSYFFELTNWNDCGSLVAYLFLMIKYDFFYDDWFSFENFKFMAALAIASTWFKAFYWMRLFEETAFFINLLTKTFEGIKAFTVMMIILIVAIANVIYVLNLKDKDTLGTEDSLFEIHLPY